MEAPTVFVFVEADLGCLLSKRQQLFRFSPKGSRRADNTTLGVSNVFLWSESAPRSSPVDLISAALPFGRLWFHHSGVSIMVFTSGRLSMALTPT